MIEQLTLESLQEWLDEISPVSIDLANHPYSIISQVDSGIAGRVRTLIDNTESYACVSTFNYEFAQGKVNKVQIRFGYVNFKTQQQIAECKWFEPQNLT